jgi:hypothetical protein
MSEKNTSLEAGKLYKDPEGAKILILGKYQEKYGFIQITHWNNSAFYFRMHIYKEALEPIEFRELNSTSAPLKKDILRSLL